MCLGNDPLPPQINVMTHDTDILIAGGGIAGMIATLILADAGQRVLCVDPAKPGSSPDLRSTAFLMPATRVLDKIGLFDQLRDHAAALRIMRIVQARNGTPTRTVDFDAAEAGEPQFGWNIPNAALRAILPQAIAAHPNADLHSSVSVCGHTPRLNETIVRLSDGSHVPARLLIAADGRDSQLREAAGISATRLRYGQKALVFAVRHDRPHDGISTEVHQSGGPFTLVPLAGPDQNRSAIVWMDLGPNIATLQDLDPDAFTAAVNTRSCGVMGPLALDGGVAAWPIIGQYASHLTGPRLALLGEAAHVVPPIGAQGLNMSLADAATLADLIRANRSDCGARDLLTRYHRKRWPDMRLRVHGIDALNKASIAGTPLGHSLRDAGLHALMSIKPLRQAAIRGGLGR